MKAKIEFNLKPFQVPNFVLIETAPKQKQDGVHFDENKLSLSQLDSETLDKLCREFTDEVFRKAGKPMLPSIQEVNNVYND